MSEFGHQFAGLPGVGFVDAWGAGPFLIRAGKRKWFFEDSNRFGPLLLRASDMMPHDKQPVSERHPFWTYYYRWQKAGRKARAIRNRRGLVKFHVCHLSREEVLR